MQFHFLRAVEPSPRPAVCDQKLLRLWGIVLLSGVTEAKLHRRTGGLVLMMPGESVASDEFENSFLASV